MISELAGRVFATRNAAHIAHWQANAQGSFARHMALDAFYNGVIEKLDGLVEMHQGAFGLITTPKIPTVDPKNIATHISQEARWITENRSEIAGGIPALENVLDDLVGLYLTTYYKLKNLA